MSARAVVAVTARRGPTGGSVDTEGAMDYGKHFANFHKRWNIEQPPQELFEQFKNRVLTAVDLSVGAYIMRTRLALSYSLVLGAKQPTLSVHRMASEIVKALGAVPFSEDPVYKSLAAARDEKELALRLQVLIWQLESHKCKLLSELEKGLRGAIRMSPGANIRIARRGKRVFLYPAGAPLLDDSVVNEVLAMLGGYPGYTTVGKYFERALIVLQKGNLDDYHTVLNELRLAFEGLLKKVLGKKSEKKIAKALDDWLEQKRIHRNLRTLIDRCRNQLKDYNEDWVKHYDPNRSSWQPRREEVEYVLY